MMSKHKNSEMSQIPLDWNIVTLGDIASKSVTNSFIDGDWIEARYITDRGIRLIQTGNIGIGKFKEKLAKKYISKDSFSELKCKSVLPGDILICRLADPIGRSCIVPDLAEEMITAVDVTIFRPDTDKYSVNYLNHYLNYDKTLQRMSSFASGSTRQRISRKNLSTVAIAVPSKVEQNKIATILTSVDQAIEKTEAIIEQTEKLKKGLMQQLLTKGIGHTKFKKTKIGVIPEEWDIKRIEECTENVFVGIATSTTNSYVSSGVPMIRSQNIKENYLNLKELLFISNEFSEKNKNKKLRKNDVITVRTGANLGDTCVVPKELENAQTFTTLITRPKQEVINSYFLSIYINSEFGKKIILGLKAGGAQPNLNVSVLKKALIPLPNLEEQTKIVQIITSIDEKVMNEKSKLQRLKIAKSGIMQVLLTGKIRVKVDKEEVTTS